MHPTEPLQSTSVVEVHASEVGLTSPLQGPHAVPVRLHARWPAWHTPSPCVTAGPP